MRGTLLRVLPTLVRERGPLSLGYTLPPESSLLLRSCSRNLASLPSSQDKGSHG